jgi:hypothetical protein
MNASPKLDAAAQQIKQIHAAGGGPLTQDDEIDLIRRQCHMYLGMPTAFRVRKATEILAAAGVPGIVEQVARNPCGRKPKNLPTQYDVLRQRWCGPYHWLIRLPSLRVGVRTHKEIERLFLEQFARGTAPRKLVSTVLADLQRDPKKPCPDERTLRRILAGMRSNFPK